MANSHQLSIPVLVICGPTATGKTSLALHLAHLFRGHLVSCDSRQVYKHLDIGTGKDIPSHFTLHQTSISGRSIPSYQDGEVNIFGYDLANPNEDFNVSHYQETAVSIIKYIHDQGRLPIIVGGTGFYLQSLFDVPQTLLIPENPQLRSELSSLSAEDLFTKYSQLSPQAAQKLNQSERHNPHRLIRKIEIATHPHQPSAPDVPYLDINTSLNIGLKYANTSIHYQIIDQRVDARATSEFDQELDHLEQLGYIDGVAARTMGYQQWIAYRRQEIDRDTAITQWKFAEHAYARRQMTWFKRLPNLQWFTLDDPDTQPEIVKLVQQWYSEFYELRA